MGIESVGIQYTFAVPWLTTDTHMLEHTHGHEKGDNKKMCFCGSKFSELLRMSRHWTRESSRAVQ